MIETLVNTIAQKLPEAPLATIREEIHRSQRELTEEGNIWIETQDLTVQAGDPPFAEVVPSTSEAELVRLFSLKLDGRSYPFTQVSPTRLEFPREPQEALTAKLVIRPATGTNLPNDLLSYWREGIMDGALGWLYEMPQPWQNDQKAQYHKALFRDAKANARQKATFGYQRGGARVRARRFI